MGSEQGKRSTHFTGPIINIKRPLCTQMSTSNPSTFRPLHIYLKEGWFRRSWQCYQLVRNTLPSVSTRDLKSSWSRCQMHACTKQKHFIFNPKQCRVLELLQNHSRSGKPKKLNALMILGFGQAKTEWASRLQRMNDTYSLPSAVPSSIFHWFNPKPSQRLLSLTSAVTHVQQGASHQLPHYVHCHPSFTTLSWQSPWLFLQATHTTCVQAKETTICSVHRSEQPYFIPHVDQNIPKSAWFDSGTGSLKPSSTEPPFHKTGCATLTPKLIPIHRDQRTARISIFHTGFHPFSFSCTKAFWESVLLVSPISQFSLSQDPTLLRLHQQ